MQIVTYPASLIEFYVGEVRRLLETGQVAEGKYLRELGETYVPGRLSTPVASGGAAIFALLAYQKYEKGKSAVIVQSNTMRCLYTVPTLLGMTPIVVDSTYEDCLAMSPEALERALADEEVRRSAVVVYSVIGGYLARSFARIVETCRRAGVRLIVDGAHAHYLAGVVAEPDVDVAYSFYATKILPAGEGGLVTTFDRPIYDWVNRFLMYDRFANELPVGLNLRAGELTSALIHRLMTDEALVGHFKTARVTLANAYKTLCQEHGVRFLDPAAAVEYNGYKFVVLDPLARVRALGTGLTEHRPTSGVFDTDVRGGPSALPHWCPPTYTCLAAS